MKRLFACSTILVALLASGCVQMPTEKQGIADIRPQISFQFNAQDNAAASARVVLDGQDVGATQDYADGVRALRILPGSHQLQVVASGRVLLNERFYLGDGVNRSFVVR